MRVAAALIIGNEILSGKIAEGNLLGLARGLRAIGVQLRRSVLILDDLETIIEEVKSLSSSHDVVFTSGGVGPTHDDLTLEGVARAFGKGLVMSPVIADLLRGYYKERLTDNHLLMARIPEGARLVASEAMPWPTVVMQNVWVLPGVPEIFAMKIPVIMSELGGDAPYLSLSVFTKLDEGHLKDALDAVVRAFPEVDVGSYPTFRSPEYTTKLTFDGKDEPKVRAARDAFVNAITRDSIVEIEG